MADHPPSLGARWFFSHHTMDPAGPGPGLIISSLTILVCNNIQSCWLLNGLHAADVQFGFPEDNDEEEPIHPAGTQQVADAASNDVRRSTHSFCVREDGSLDAWVYLPPTASRQRQPPVIVMASVSSSLSPETDGGGTPHPAGTVVELYFCSTSCTSTHYRPCSPG